MHASQARNPAGGDNNNSKNAENNRRASIQSYEAWLPKFAGLHKPKGIDEVFLNFDEFVFKKDSKPRNCFANCTSLPWTSSSTLRILGNGSQKEILIAKRKRSLLYPLSPPVLVYDAIHNSKILRLDSYFGRGNFCQHGVVQVLSSTGIIGLIKLTHTNGIKTYEIYDSYSQLAFQIMPNLTPHPGIELLVLGSERSLLTGALVEREEDYVLEIFKPLSPMLKAVLVSFSLYIINNNITRGSIS